MSTTTRKKCKFKDDLIYSHGLLLVDETKTSICRFYLSSRRPNVQREAQRDVPGAQPAAAASSAGPPKKQRRASMNLLYFSEFSRALLN
jgi:hypothetical protein